MTDLCSTLPGLRAGLHLALCNGLVRVGGLVIDVLDPWDGLPLFNRSKHRIDKCAVQGHVDTAAMTACSISSHVQT